MADTKNREVLSNRVIASGAFSGNLTGAPKKVGEGLIGRIMIGGIGCDVNISEKMSESLKEAGYTKTRLTVLGDMFCEQVKVDGKEYSNYSLRGSLRYADSDYFFAIANGGLIEDVKVGTKEDRTFATGAVVSTVGKNGDEDIKVLTSAIGSFDKAAEYATKGRRVRFSGPARVEVNDNGLARVSIQGASLGLGPQKKEEETAEAGASDEPNFG